MTAKFPSAAFLFICFTVWYESFAIFAIFPVIRKNKFPQIKFTADIFFPQKIYSRVNSVYKNTVVRNRVCSITTCAGPYIAGGRRGQLPPPGKLNVFFLT